MKSKLSEITLEDMGTQNKIKNFYPFRVNDTKKCFKFDEIIGLLIDYISSKKLKKFDLEIFKKKCLTTFEENIDDKEAIKVLENIYFKKDKIEINSLLTKQTNISNSKNNDIFEIFKELINNKKLDIRFESNLNFIEQIILNELKKELKYLDSTFEKTSYLPFLEELFSNDLKFLSSNKHYFIRNLESFLELYLFIYCSQLALNLQPIENALSEPSSKELYFILNSETASKERKKIQEFGYEKLYEKSKYIFPYLSLLSIFSKKLGNENLKLYELIDKFEESDISLIDKFNNLYRESRSLNHQNESSTNLIESFKRLLNSSFEQFKKGQSTRNDVLIKYIKGFENNVSAPFYNNRGRAGKVLVLDQDRLILLTNISIGNKKKIRLQELLNEFNKRGIYFDIKSQTELINTFEKIGNIERKSDSGDAVYVKTTI